MSFSGKATYTAGATLPEIAEDVGDIIGIVSPHETPLLDHLGDAQRPAVSTIHEWLEDELLPNTDAVDDQSLSGPTPRTTNAGEDRSRFQTGEQIMLRGKTKVMLGSGISSNELKVERNCGGSGNASVADSDASVSLVNAAL